MSATSTNTGNITLQVHSSIPVVLDFGSFLKNMSDEEFFKFCQRNRDWRIERTKEGDLVIKAPTYTETGGYNFNLAGEFAVWVKKDKTGKGFDSSSGFTLPNGAIRSPDLSWIRWERWNALPQSKKQKFAHICPDFVIELRSKTDSLKKLKAKMEEYIENGALLGWLIDPIERRVYVYRPNTELEVLDDPQEVSGEPLLKGFVLKMKEIWD